MSPRKSLWTFLLSIMLLSFYATSSPALIEGGGEKHDFTKDFMIDRCSWTDAGANPFFVLTPGFQLVLEGEEDKEEVQVVITVLYETEDVDDVTTRVVEEKEWKDGQLIEVSRNFFAICVETNSVFYFGEEVFICESNIVGSYPNYECEGGEEVSNEGEWLAFEDAEEGEGVNMPGIIMPGTILKQSRFYQEIAPGIAMDRAVIESMDETVESPAAPGPDYVFEGCLMTTETTPLEPNSKDFKIYAPDIGLVVDGPLVLICYGNVGDCNDFIPD